MHSDMAITAGAGTVRGDDAELVAAFRRHGVKPRWRLHVAIVDRNFALVAGGQLALGGGE